MVRLSRKSKSIGNYKKKQKPKTYRRYKSSKRKYRRNTKKIKMKGGSNLSKESQIINDVFGYAIKGKLPNVSDAFYLKSYTFYKQSGVAPTNDTIYLHIYSLETRGVGYNGTVIGYVKLSEPEKLITEPEMVGLGIRLEYMKKKELKNSFPPPPSNETFEGEYDKIIKYPMSDITYINEGTNSAIALNTAIDNATTLPI